MRPLDADDLKYMFAAWRMGQFGFDNFEVDGETPEVFTESVAKYLAERFQIAWTMLAEAPGKGVMPVGIVFGILPYKDKKVLWAGDFRWFPWASNRNRLEAAVHFLNQIRKEWFTIGFVNMSELAFFEHICRYGVLRRVGTVFDMRDDGPLALFQTRKPYKG